MAGAGYKLFNTGDVLTAAQVNTYLQEQTVMVFASSAARTTALSGVLAEGMMSYLQDTNAVQVYNGTSWVSVGGSSPLTTKGDLYGFSTVDARIPIGTNGHVLTADSTESLGLKWAAPAGGGKVLQIVQDVSTTQESTTSATYVDTLLSIAITPSATSSKVLCIFAAPVRSSSTTAATSVLSYYNLVRTSTEIAATNISFEGASQSIALHGTASIVYLDSPSTTSATTYKVQMRRAVTNNTTFMAVESQTATLTLIEIGA